jgi:5-methyltetrahydropteroyltriglutamate--homocysteine methyltransferase
MDQWLAQGIEMDNAVMAGFPGVTFGFHLCRGNQAGRWLVAGGYDPIAKPIFRGVRAHRLLLEYDDARSGTFAPLLDVPIDKMVVLGLVTTKSPRRETIQELILRIRDAGRFFPVENLALSPQCGFSSSILGSALSLEDQNHKLRLIVETANAVWG